MVDEYQEKLLAMIRENFNTTILPPDEKEDANDIIVRLEENLDECQKALDDDHKLFEYKKCVREKVDEASNEIWEFRQEHESASYDDDDDDVDHSHSSESSLTLFVYFCVALCLINLPLYSYN